MLLKKFKELDNVRRGVIPGLDGALKKDKDGFSIPDPETDAQRASYETLKACPVGGTCEVPAAAAEWLKRYGYFGDLKPEESSNDQIQ